ncbi:unnamed protein product [Rotaria sp. Silwood1]|nr:unnamed protein product [Rotaria sp. Silwood1]CAF3731452.1 unnamed protein product [Rotaria sp. Silwood1]CAF3751776.1 unnamed protein product [Rotaria sp. Silwood1]CAF4998074.1 unnamed protein product [Rotaria sp. Silwood1]CAF5092903.1 unnamed protein product [Rotaria sp. Silwood1]
MESFETVTIPSRDKQYIIERLEEHEHMTHEEAVDSVDELAHYYTAIKHGKNGSPSKMVDKAWHAHILNTQMYMDFTKAEIGRFVHHVPYWSGHQSNGTEDDIYEYLVSQLGAEHVNATVWVRDGAICENSSHSLGRCQNAFLPMRNPTDKKRNVFHLISRYDPFNYWMMCLDPFRLDAYEEAIRQHRQQKAIWLDIGTGAHMPLTRLLIKYETAEHVYAVEANREAYRFAKNLRECLSDEEKRKISLYGCYSNNIDWHAQDPRPNAIIHEIIGCIPLDEGCIKVMHDTIKNPNGEVYSCIPYKIGTLCMPVSRPKRSRISSFCSFLLSSSMKIIKDVGIQGMFNPHKDAFLCETPQFIEEFILQDYVRKPLESHRVFKTKFIVEKRTGK